MTTYYIDPEWTGAESGTKAEPFDSYSDLPPLSAGDYVLQKAGTTFAGRLTAGYSGSAGLPITYGVYDGATGAQVTTTAGAAIIYANGDGTAPAISSGSQGYVEFVGLEGQNAGAGRPQILVGKFTGDKDGCFARYCVGNSSATNGIEIDCAPGPVGGGAEYCVTTSNTQNGIVIAGNVDFVNLLCDNNTCAGNAASGIRWSPSSTDKYLTGLSSMSKNVCNSNGYAGIRHTGNVFSCVVKGNTANGNAIAGLVIGTFAGGTDFNKSSVRGNTCLYNVQFGIQVVSAKGWIVERNTCNYNGVNTGSNYGRGIEIYGAVGRTSTGVVRYNTCNYNYNFGGTLNNGTEGCGIGLDDYHESVLCYGNVCIGNEGNGIQVNANGAAGSSVVSSNLLVNNFNVSAARVAAGSWASILCSQIYTGTTEANLTIAGNTFVNTGVATCKYEISEGASASASGVVMVNNSFNGATTAALKVRDAITRTNNAFWRCTINAQTNTSGVALTDGTDAVTANPLLSPSYRPLPGSPLIGAGTYIAD